jgi:hypothetical protein
LLLSLSKTKQKSQTPVSLLTIMLIVRTIPTRAVKIFFTWTVTAMNALDAEIVSVLMTDHSVRRLSPLAVLQHRHQVARVVGYAADMVSHTRFLIALYGWGVKRSKDPVSYLDDQRHLFEMEGERAFYQLAPNDPTLLRKAVGYLYQEVPTGDNHVYSRGFVKSFDGRYGFCLPCCLNGMLRSWPFGAIGGKAKNGSRGIQGTVHKYLPTYVIPVTPTLDDLLALHPMTDGTPVWEAVPKSTDVDHLPRLTGLTWPCRGYRLFPGEGGVCNYCGAEADRLVRDVLLMRAIDRSGDDWQLDPHVCHTRPNLGNSVENFRNLDRFETKSLVPAILKDVAEGLDTKTFVRAATGDTLHVQWAGLCAKHAKVTYEYRSDLTIENLLQAVSAEDPTAYVRTVTRPTPPPPAERPAKKYRQFFSTLKHLPQTDRDALAACRGNLSTNPVAYAAYSQVYRKKVDRQSVRPSNRMAALLAASAYAAYPVFGRTRPTPLPDMIGAGPERRREWLFAFVDTCQKKNLGVDWDYVVDLLTVTSGKAR